VVRAPRPTETLVQLLRLEVGSQVTTGPRAVYARPASAWGGLEELEAASPEALNEAESEPRNRYRLECLASSEHRLAWMCPPPLQWILLATNCVLLFQINNAYVPVPVTDDVHGHNSTRERAARRCLPKK
jgi:hypothetical protein